MGGPRAPDSTHPRLRRTYIYLKEQKIESQVQFNPEADPGRGHNEHMLGLPHGIVAPLGPDSSRAPIQQVRVAWQTVRA